MAVFKGRLSLAGDATSVAADLDVTSDRLIVRSGGVVIGDWPRSEVAASSNAAGVVLQAEGEELLFTSSTLGLLSALGLASQPALITRFQEAAKVQAVAPRRMWWRQPAAILLTAFGVAATGITALALMGGNDNEPNQTSSTTLEAAAPATTTQAGTAHSTTTEVAPTDPSTTLPATTSTQSTVTPTTRLPTTTAPPATTAHPMTAPPATTAPATTAPPPPPPTLPPRNLSSIGPGTWFVGSDIQPGTWESWPSLLTACLWARLSGPDFVLGNIIESGGGPPPGGNSVAAIRVIIQATDVAFYNTGCGTWNRVG